MRAAFGDRPANAVGSGGENEADGTAEGSVQFHKGMRSESGEESAGSLEPKMKMGEGCGRKHRVGTESRHEVGLIGEPEHGAECVFGKFPPAIDQGTHEAAPFGAVQAEVGGGLLEVAIEDDSGSIVEGVSERDFRMDPGEAVAIESKRAEKG